MTSASQESSGPGDSDSIVPAAPAISHWKGLLCGGGWRSKPKRRKDAPRSQSGQPGPSCGWLPPLPKTLSGSQSCLGAAWLTLLPIVYSEGVIHKNSRTTSLFPSLRSLLVLVPPSTLSSIKAGELKLCLLKELGRLGVWPRKEADGGRRGEKPSRPARCVWQSGSLSLCACAASIPPLAVGCRLLAPSLL